MWSVHPTNSEHILIRNLTIRSTDVTGAAARGISLANVRGAKLRDIKVNGYAGPLIGVNNVSGSGLKGAAIIDPPKLLDPVPPPARPYQLR